VEAGLALSNQTLTVTRAASTVTASVADTTISSGTAPSVTVRVTANGIAPTGSVTVSAGTKKATVALVEGVARVELPKLAGGSYPVTVAYLGDKGVEPSSADSVATLAVTKTPAALTATVGTVKVKVAAKAKTAPKAKTARIAAGKRAQVKVNVAASGVDLPTGTVKAVVYKGAKKYKSVKVTLRSSQKGAVTVSLPKLAKGTYTLTIAYAGNTSVAKKSAKLFKLKVN